MRHLARQSNRQRERERKRDKESESATNGTVSLNLMDTNRAHTQLEREMNQLLTTATLQLGEGMKQFFALAQFDLTQVKIS